MDMVNVREVNSDEASAIKKIFMSYDSMYLTQDVFPCKENYTYFLAEDGEGQPIGYAEIDDNDNNFNVGIYYDPKKANISSVYYALMPEVVRHCQTLKDNESSRITVCCRFIEKPLIQCLYDDDFKKVKGNFSLVFDTSEGFISQHVSCLSGADSKIVYRQTIYTYGDTPAKQYEEINVIEAILDDCTIGSLTVTRVMMFGEIKGFYVTPEYQHNGIGRSLMTYALKYFTSKGSNLVHVSIPTSDLNSLKFFTELGFKLDDSVDIYAKVL